MLSGGVTMISEAIPCTMKALTDGDRSIRVDQLPKGTRLLLKTVNRDYLVETSGGLNALLQGHPKYCPKPVAVYVAGARRRGCAPDPGCIRCGMRAEFWDPTRGMIRISRVRHWQLVKTLDP